MTLEGNLGKLSRLEKEVKRPTKLYGIPVMPIGVEYDGRYDEYWLSQGRSFRPLIIHKEDLPPGVEDLNAMEPPFR